MPARIRIILFGASEFPRASSLNEGGNSFRAAHRALKHSLSIGLAFDEECMLDLFDSSLSATDHEDEIQTFLNSTATKDSVEGSEDYVLVFYIGHGGLRDQGADYFLSIKATRESNQYQTSIATEQLAKVLRSHARHSRRFIFLDACFAASAVHNFQSTTQNVVNAQIRATKWNGSDQSKGGTALLCAASKFKPARFTSDGTMFTTALANVLANGNEALPELISLSQLFSEIVERIEKNHGLEGVFPELHVPDQRGGRVELLPLFRNSAAGVVHARAPANSELTFIETNEQKQLNGHGPEVGEKAKLSEALQDKEVANEDLSTVRDLSTLSGTSISDLFRKLIVIAVVTGFGILAIVVTAHNAANYFSSVKEPSAQSLMSPVDIVPVSSAHTSSPTGQTTQKIPATGVPSNQSPISREAEANSVPSLYPGETRIYFDFDSYNFRTDVMDSLNKKLDAIFRARNSQIVLTGVLNTADKTESLALTSKRVSKIKSYLESRYIPVERIKVREPIRVKMKQGESRNAEARSVIVAGINSGDDPSPILPTYLNKASFDTASKSMISTAYADFSAANTLTIIVLVGHTHTFGSDEYLQKLGSRLAESAKSYLVSIGAPQNYIYTESKGRKQPVSDDLSMRNQWKNQRVDVLFRGKNNATNADVERLFSVHPVNVQPLGSTPTRSRPVTRSVELNGTKRNVYRNCDSCFPGNRSQVTQVTR